MVREQGSSEDGLSDCIGTWHRMTKLVGGIVTPIDRYNHCIWRRNVRVAMRVGMVEAAAADGHQSSGEHFEVART